MAKFKIEFKAIKRDDNGEEVTQFKKVVDEAALSTLVTTYATAEGVEYFTVRKVPEAKPKPAPAAKAVTK